MLLQVSWTAGKISAWANAQKQLPKQDESVFEAPAGTYLKTTCLRHCHAGGRHDGDGRFGPDLTTDEPGTMPRSGRKSPEKLRLWDSESGREQARFPDAAMKLSDGTGRRWCATGDAALARHSWERSMSSECNSGFEPQNARVRRGWRRCTIGCTRSITTRWDSLHSLRSIISRNRRTRSDRDPIQLMRPHNDFVLPSLQPMYDARHDDDFFVIMPFMFGFANYLVPLMIRRARHGIPQVNAFSLLTAFGGFLLYSVPGEATLWSGVLRRRHGGRTLR